MNLAHAPAIDADRRLDASTWTDADASAKATRAAQARQVSGRRRLIDPTTCDRDYTEAEVEFMQAMARYKAASGRMFPTWSEVLEVLTDLGYQKATADGLERDASEVEPAREVALAS